MIKSEALIIGPPDCDLTPASARALRAQMRAAVRAEGWRDVAALAERAWAMRADEALRMTWAQFCGSPVQMPDAVGARLLSVGMSKEEVASLCGRR